IGELWFVSERPKEGDAQRKFAVRFNKFMIGPTERDEDRSYIFDGQWLMEKDAKERSFLKKQVVGPGEHFDPLKLGQGPFVLPIGQRKADIKDRYNVELLPAEAGLDPGPDATESDRKEAEENKKAVA